MDAKQKFTFYKNLLKKLVHKRGQDPATVDQEFIWPEQIDSTQRAPKDAVSLAHLLTGENSEQKNSDPTNASGIVSVPPGLSPPEN